MAQAEYSEARSLVVLCPYCRSQELRPSVSGNRRLNLLLRLFAIAIRCCYCSRLHYRFRLAVFLYGLNSNGSHVNRVPRAGYGQTRSHSPLPRSTPEIAAPPSTPRRRGRRSEVLYHVFAPVRRIAD